MITFSSIISKIIGLLGLLVLPIIGLAVVFFLYGLLGYILNSGDQNKRSESIKYILYGIIGLFVMVSLWGLVYILSSFFGFGFGIPQIETL